MCCAYRSEEKRGLIGQRGKGFVLDNGIAMICVEVLLFFGVGGFVETKAINLVTANCERGCTVRDRVFNIPG